MSDQARPDDTTANRDCDGVRVVAVDSRGQRKIFAYKALALFLVACSAGYLLTPRSNSSQAGPTAPDVAASSPMDKLIQEAAKDAAHEAQADEEASAESSPTFVASPRAKETHQPVRAVPVRAEPPHRAKPEEPEQDDSATLADYLPPREDLTVAEVIQELNSLGIHDGIGAFQPPGTSPPLVGLSVPEDFELPPGYVRHYQTTDDGQAIAPILMFSVDYEFVDETGAVVTVPENRVVPPDLAPPGFPIEDIEIPPAREPGDLSR